MDLKEQARLCLVIREQGIKYGMRAEGCPIWDNLSKNLWIRIVNDVIGKEEASKESQKIMAHCKTWRHPMCIKALFGDVKPKVVGE